MSFEVLIKIDGIKVLFDDEDDWEEYLDHKDDEYCIFRKERGEEVSLYIGYSPTYKNAFTIIRSLTAFRKGVFKEYYIVSGGMVTDTMRGDDTWMVHGDLISGFIHDDLKQFPVNFTTTEARIGNEQSKCIHCGSDKVWYQPLDMTANKELICPKCK